MKPDADELALALAKPRSDFAAAAAEGAKRRIIIVQRPAAEAAAAGSPLATGESGPDGHRYTVAIQPPRSAETRSASGGMEPFRLESPSHLADLGRR